MTIFEGEPERKYDAVAFLASLFSSSDKPRPSLVTVADLSPADLPPDWYVVWDERSALMEYDGGLPREVSEHFALIETVKLMRDAEPGGRPA